jgi:hypothetical protein
MSARCPYCNASLDSVPKRKKKCPSCGKPIYVRQGKLRTEFDALMADWLNYLAPLDITKKRFIDTKNALAEQFGQPPGFYDVVWRILEDVVATSRSPAILQCAYSEMARAADFEKRDPRPYQDLASKYYFEATMASFRENDLIRSVMIYSFVNDDLVCDACKALSGQIFPIDEVPPLPYEKCTSPVGCRCGLKPHITEADIERSWEERARTWDDICPLPVKEMKPPLAGLLKRLFGRD